jgi:hypothetical protein
MYSNAPLTIASLHDRQHTELAGTTTERPAAPLHRDEEVLSSLQLQQMGDETPEQEPGL